MTKEQEEAIKECEDKIKNVKPEYTETLVDGKLFRSEIIPIKMRFDKEDAEKMKIILNILKEKDAEIEKYKKKNKELSNQILILYKEQDDYNARIDKKNTELKKKNEELDMYKDIKEIANSKATELVKLKQYDDLKKKVDRQDKMIDLMAEWISGRCLYIDDYGNSCEIIQDSCNKRNNCEDCIKQYFERKATNDG